MLYRRRPVRLTVEHLYEYPADRAGARGRVAMVSEVGWVLLGMWFNGIWGRMARKNIWLYATGDGSYVVRARQGHSDDPEHDWPYACEPDARAMVQHLIDTDTGPGAGEWRELKTALRRPDTEGR